MRKINHFKTAAKTTAPANAKAVNSTTIKMTAMNPKRFELGRLVMTPGTLALAKTGEDFGPLVARHVSGDWGDVSVEDKAANDCGITTGDILLSSYTIGNSEVWLYTERDRSITTILLPEEY